MHYTVGFVKTETLEGDCVNDSFLHYAFLAESPAV